MRNINIQILGSKGYLGSFLFNKFIEDRNISVVGDGFYPENIDYLINCAGLVSVEDCENCPEKSFESNCGYFVRHCDKIKPKKIINMSSYFVYDSDYKVFKTNYAIHKHMSDVYTINKDGLVLILGKLFGVSPNQQNRFPEMCIIKGITDCEEVIHPFTYLECVYKYLQNEIYSYKKLSGRINLLNFNAYPHDFAKKCGKTNDQINIVPFLEKFEGYGNFIMSEEDFSDYYIKQFKEDFERRNNA